MDLCFNSLFTSTSPEGAGDSPGIGFLVAVVQRLEALLFLLLAETSGVRHFKESRRKLHQPAGVNGGHLPHVLLCGQHQLMVNNPEEEMSGVGGRSCFVIIKSSNIGGHHTTLAGG